MEILVKASLAVVLLLTVSASSSAQPLTISASSSVRPPACFDGTPHEKMLVQVGSTRKSISRCWTGGAGKSRTMVLLTGLGDNAHVYDQFAFQFTDYFHVIGITRRGYPPSSLPGPGPNQVTDYDLATRARDDIAVLDFLGISKAVFVGRSVAGSELSTIAVKYGHRVEKLVYLDAFDLSKRFQLPDIPPAPDPEEDHRSLQSFLAASERLQDILRPAQEVCITVHFDKNGMLRPARHRPGYPQRFFWVCRSRQLHQRIGRRSRHRALASSANRPFKASCLTTGT